MCTMSSSIRPLDAVRDTGGPLEAVRDTGGLLGGLRALGFYLVFSLAFR